MRCGHLWYCSTPHSFRWTLVKEKGRAHRHKGMRDHTPERKLFYLFRKSLVS